MYIIYTIMSLFIHMHTYFRSTKPSLVLIQRLASDTKESGLFPHFHCGSLISG